jgi:HlyD family secretion protein
MKFTARALKVALVSLVVIGLAACSAIPSGWPFSAATPPPLPTISLDNTTTANPAGTASSQGVGTGVVASGTVEPAQEAHIAFLLAGKVKSVSVAVGDQVTAGQALVQLEGQESLQAAISAAQYELVQAQQALDALSKDLDVQQAQALKAVADDQDAVRDAERALANLNAQAKQVDLDAAYANMILAKDQLDKAREDFEPYTNKPVDNPVRATLLSKMAQAQKVYDAAVSTLNNLSGTANPLDVSQAEANLAIAQAQLAKAQRDYEVIKAGPDPDQVQLAQARLANAQTQLAAAEAALNNLSLTAPFAATITAVNTHNGEWIIPGQPVVELVDLSSLHIETSDLSERDVPKVSIGQPVTVSIKALNQEVAGRVSDISPLASTLGGDVVYKTTIHLDAIPPELRAGMSVDVQFGTTP